MNTALFLIIFGTIYGLGGFALYDRIIKRHSVWVDDNGYPIKKQSAEVIPLPVRARRREVA